MSEKFPEVALKIHRRRYGNDGRREFFVTRYIVEQGLPLDAVSVPFEGFEAAEGHVCLAYPLLGKDLNGWNQDRGRPFSVEETRRIAKKTLVFLDAFHESGAAHTDIKPDNFLYDPGTGEIRLIDFGNSERRFKRGTPVATREYTPPEGIIGGELGPAVDLWSFACTIFELLTREFLFDPHEAAAEKYVEFSDDGDEDEAEEEASSSGEDPSEEEGPYAKGRLVAGKYRILEELGSGHFARVWRAKVVHPDRHLEPLSRPAGSEVSAGVSSAPAVPQTSGVEAPVSLPDRAREARRNNRKRFGVTDTYDLALNYEHLLLMQNLLGPCPSEMAKDGIFHQIYFRPDGVLKFDPSPEPVAAEKTISARLVKSGIAKEEATQIESLLLAMLRYEPRKRATAEQCLAHSWLSGA
ncbi:MAG: hypothetical protein KDN18_07640 [Verrucomicrobiae bacterium]|nr:hypothetical protein [Verrucomicrobiae bacterium]